MQNAFKKIGAVIGSALMLGSTLGGAALAAPNMSDFYDGIAVVDGKADDALIVIGTGGSSPSGIAQDVVSAIGVAKEIGQNAKETAAGGAGEVTLTVSTTKIDGKQMKSEIGRYLNETLTQPNITFYAEGRGGNVLSTLGTRNVRNYGGTAQLNEEYVTISNLGNAKIDYQYSDLVISTTGTEGFDKTEVEFPYASKWIRYRSTIELPVDFDGALKGAKMRFLGKDYTALSATATQIKLAGKGTEQTLSVGDDPIEFSDGVKDYKTSLKSVLLDTVQANKDKALIEVETGGTTASKLVTEGSSETINGLEVTVTTAGSSVALDLTSGQATILLGADTLTLKNNQAMKTGSPWTVAINTGADTSSTETNSDGLSYIDLTFSKGYTGATAIGEGKSIPGMDDLGGLLTMTYDGLDAVDKKQMKLELYGQIDLDNANDADATYVLKVSYPTKIFTVGSEQVDTIYYALSYGQGDSTVGQAYYYRASTGNYTNEGAPSAESDLQFTIGDKLYKLNMNTTGGFWAPSAYLQFTEPQTAYPTGSGATNNFRIIIYNDTTNSRCTEFGTGGTAANSNVTLFSATTTNFATPTVTYYDSSQVLRHRGNFVTPWGTVASSGSASMLTFELPAVQAKALTTLGSTVDSTTEVTATLGGDSVTVEGLNIAATGAVSSEVVNPWAMPVAKVDTDLTATDKANKNLVCIGGPLVNACTAAIAQNYPDDVVITNDDPGAGKGKVIVVDDPYAGGNDNYGVVVAGSDRQGTNAAAQLLETLDQFDASDLASTMVTVQYTAAGTAPTIVE